MCEWPIWWFDERQARTRKPHRRKPNRRYVQYMRWLMGISHVEITFDGIEWLTFLFTLRFLLCHLISCEHASRRNLTIVIGSALLLYNRKMLWLLFFVRRPRWRRRQRRRYAARPTGIKWSQRCDGMGWVRESIKSDYTAARNLQDNFEIFKEWLQCVWPVHATSFFPHSLAVDLPMRLPTAETTTLIQQSITTSTTTTTTTAAATETVPTNDLCEIYGECDKKDLWSFIEQQQLAVRFHEKNPSNKSKNQNEMYLFRKRIACNKRDNKCSMSTALAWMCL